MSDFVIDAPLIPSIPVSGGGSFPVRRVYCIGRNYSAHAKEMGGEVTTTPVVFIKPSNAYVPTGSKVSVPSYSNEMHHEVELVVVIGKDCRSIVAEKAMDYVAGYGVGLDFTLRDVQSEAKAKGLPWSTAKSFYASAPVSNIIPIAEIENCENCYIELEKKGIIVQKGYTSEMQHSVPQLIAYLSQVFGLRKGDCIFTGTPKGVGPVESGDKLVATLANKAQLEIEIE